MNTLLMAAALLVNSFYSQGTSDSTVTNSSPLIPGQVWHYHTRPGEEKSTLTILRVDTTARLGILVHIAVDGVRVKNPGTDGVTTKLPHLPFSEKAVRRSVTTKVRDRAAIPDYREGYSIWRHDFDSGRAGVYTITVAEVVTIVEKTLNQ